MKSPLFGSEGNSNLGNRVPTSSQQPCRPPATFPPSSVGPHGREQAGFREPALNLFPQTIHALIQQVPLLTYSLPVLWKRGFGPLCLRRCSQCKSFSWLFWETSVGKSAIISAPLDYSSEGYEVPPLIIPPNHYRHSFPSFLDECCPFLNESVVV